MPKRFAIGTLISAADQALLSLFSLALSLAFIRGTEKSEFATFTLMFVAVQLLQSVQNAVVSSPLATLMPARAEPDARRVVLEAALTMQRWLLGGVAVAAASASAAASLSGSAEWALLTACTGLAGVGVMSRELGRTVQFLRHAPQRALTGDAGYVLLGALGMVATFFAGWFSAPTALAVVGLAGLGSSLAMHLAGHGVREGPRRMEPPAALAAERKALWGCARWALPSVVNSWMYANAFLYAVEAVLGKEAVADMSAARLVLVPLTLLMTGWSMTFRPRAAAWLAHGQADRLHRGAVISAWALAGASLAYGAAIWLGWRPLLQPLLGPEYAGLEPLLALWLVFFTLANLRGVGMSAMLASPGAFRTLFFYGLATTLLAAAGVAIALAGREVHTVLWALIVAEATLVALIWARGWPAIRRAAQAPVRDQKHE